MYIILKHRKISQGEFPVSDGRFYNLEESLLDSEKFKRRGSRDAPFIHGNRRFMECAFYCFLGKKYEFEA